MIHIPSELLEDIIAHSENEAPNEVCGWLAGKEDTVEKTYPVPNVAPGPKGRFVMGPEGQLSAMRDIRDSGLELVGTYHSHPRSPARPSEADKNLALYPRLAHLIVSLAGMEPEFHCWRITEEKVVEIKTEWGERLV